MKLFKKLFSLIDPPIRFENLHESEIIPGVSSPTTVLAGMICAKLLSEDFSPKNNSFKTDRFEIRWVDKEIGDGYKGFDTETLRAICDEYSRQQGYVPGYRTPSEIRSSSLLKTYVDKRLEGKTPPDRTGEFSCDVTDVIIYTTPEVAFSDYDKKLIKEGLKKALKLHNNRLLTKKEEENQTKALTVIEQWMGIPES